MRACGRDEINSFWKLFLLEAAWTIQWNLLVTVTVNSTRAAQEGCSNSVQQSEVLSIKCKHPVTLVQLGGSVIFIAPFNSCNMFCAIMFVYEKRGRRQEVTVMTGLARAKRTC